MQRISGGYDDDGIRVIEGGGGGGNYDDGIRVIQDSITGSGGYDDDGIRVIEGGRASTGYDDGIRVIEGDRANTGYDDGIRVIEGGDDGGARRIEGGSGGGGYDDGIRVIEGDRSNSDARRIEGGGSGYDDGIRVIEGGRDDEIRRIEGGGGGASGAIVASSGMDRGDGEVKRIENGAPSSSLRKLEGASMMKIRQARRGWCQELLCCNYRSDFTYYADEKKIAKSTEEYSKLCRCACGPTHAFDMTVLEKSGNNETEIIDMERPFRFPLGPCKICCKQEATISSGDDDLGEVRETFWCCVPQFKVYDDDDETVYIVQPPTCCGGACVDCCNEGNCCPHGCHLIPWRIYSADALSTTGDAPWIGRMAKIPKDTFGDVFNEMQTYELEFPEDASKERKGLLLGSSLLINALFFEGSE